LEKHYFLELRVTRRSRECPFLTLTSMRKAVGKRAAAASRRSTRLDAGLAPNQPSTSPAAEAIEPLLSVQEAGSRLGVKTTTLYSWLGLSDVGLFEVRGQNITINYFQGGPRGQGRIRIEAREIHRLKELMRIQPQVARPRKTPVRPQSFPGINVPLGRPGTVS
jgi:hypothetical protein